MTTRLSSAYVSHRDNVCHRDNLSVIVTLCQSCDLSSVGRRGHTSVGHRHLLIVFVIAIHRSVTVTICQSSGPPSVGRHHTGRSSRPPSIDRRAHTPVARHDNLSAIVTIIHRSCWQPVYRRDNMSVIVTICRSSLLSVGHYNTLAAIVTIC